jgi:hypothetical protein
MRKDVREFIRRLEAAGLTVESTPGHYNVLRDGKPLRKTNGMPFTLPFSPDTTRWRRDITGTTPSAANRLLTSKKRRDCVTGTRGNHAFGMSIELPPRPPETA